MNQLVITKLSEINQKHADDTIEMQNHIKARCLDTLLKARDPRDRFLARALLNAACHRIELSLSLIVFKEDPIRSAQICQQIVDEQPEVYPCQIRDQAMSSSVVIQPNSSKHMFLKLLKMVMCR